MFWIYWLNSACLFYCVIGMDNNAVVSNNIINSSVCLLISDVCRQEEEESAPENTNLTEKTAFYIRQFQVESFLSVFGINEPAVCVCLRARVCAAKTCFV